MLGNVTEEMTVNDSDVDMAEKADMIAKALRPLPDPKHLVVQKRTPMVLPRALPVPAGEWWEWVMGMTSAIGDWPTDGGDDQEKTQHFCWVLWWARSDSNRGLLPCEGNTLPLSYAPTSSTAQPVTGPASVVQTCLPWLRSCVCLISPCPSSLSSSLWGPAFKASQSARRSRFRSTAVSVRPFSMRPGPPT